MSERWTVISPDGIPIEPKTYPSETAARRALARWVNSFRAQGYYAGASNGDRRISIDELPARCAVSRVQ